MDLELSHVRVAWNAVERAIDTMLRAHPAEIPEAWHNLDTARRNMRLALIRRYGQRRPIVVG